MGRGALGSSEHESLAEVMAGERVRKEGGPKVVVEPAAGLPERPQRLGTRGTAGEPVARSNQRRQQSASQAVPQKVNPAHSGLRLPTISAGKLKYRGQ
jgi:hypothetical protein